MALTIPHRRHLHRITAVLAAAGATAAVAPAVASAMPARCEASALRGTVLGAATIEPVTANRNGTPCVDAQGGLAGALPSPLNANLVFARTVAENPAGRPDLQRGIAVGGLAGLRISALPELPITLPVDTVLDAVPPLVVPIPLLSQILIGTDELTIDLRPALQALLPAGRLPTVDLVTADAVVATAGARCVNGSPDVATASNVLGLKVLGQDVVPGALVNHSLTLIDTASIDPSDIDLSLLTLPLGLDILSPTVGPLLQSLIQPALDLLPDIAIPATVANVNVSAGARTEAAGLVTQQALRVQASILGQPIADLAVGEASASAAGLDCTPPAPAPAPPPAAVDATPTATDLALGCTKRRLVLQDVKIRDGKVQLLGAADRTLAGKTVSIRFLATKKVVARAKVREDGSFRATARVPSKRLRSTNRARYQASVGKERSLDLKLTRRMSLKGVAVRRGTVTIAGRVSRPLTRRISTITVQRRVSCKKLETVKRVKPRKDGTFRITLPAPEGELAAVYRLKTFVQKTTRNTKKFATFTLPRAVTLK